jgi:Lipopolysaccharide kinase (Kdo/WaaP) family
MLAASDYRWIRTSDWRLVVLAGSWDDLLQDRVRSLVDKQAWAKHPQTLPLSSSSAAEKDSDLFLKVLHRSKGSSGWKNWLRRSKAFQAWRQGLALSEAGFNVPVTLAAGVRRRFGGLRSSFILTRKVAGQGAPFFLRELRENSSDKNWLQAKRAGLLQLAAIIRRLHENGFVHGDLLATNIFIERSEGDRMRFFFMDNDRTRRYPCWLPHVLWKRNLIQLNRLPLPGITLQDRMRFFCAYLGKPKLTAAERNLARWFERKTRQRRMECDRVDASMNFRQLMRWTPDPLAQDGNRTR